MVTVDNSLRQKNTSTGILPVTPIYDDGRLIGIEDPNSGTSRLPTDREKLLYGRQPSSGGGSSGGSSSGGSSSGSNLYYSNPSNVSTPNNTSNQQSTQPPQTILDIIPKPIYQSTKLGIYEPKTKTYYNENTGLPVGVANSGTTSLVGYKDYTSELGYVKGTLAYTGNYLSSEVDKYQMQNDDYYQQEAFRNIGYLAPSTIYLTPVVGPGLFVVGGAETIYKADTISEKASGLGEVGLGAFGLRSEFKAFSASRELAAFEKSSTIIQGARLEGEMGGVDILYGLKKTKYGDYLTQIKQPYYNVGESKFTLEGGQAISLGFKKGNKIDVSMSEVSGRGINFDTAPRIGKTKLNEPYLDTQPTRISADIDGYSSTFGKVNVNTIYTGRLKYNVDIISGKANVIGKIKPSDVKTSSHFIGGGKFEEGYIDFFGAKADTLRLFKIDEFKMKTTLSASSSPSLGRMKVYKLGGFSGGFSIGNMGLKTVKMTPSYAPQLTEQSMKSLIQPQSVSFRPVSVSNPKMPLFKQTFETQPRQKSFISLSSSQIFGSAESYRSSSSQIQSTQSMLKQSNQLKLLPAQNYLTGQGTRITPVQLTEQFTNQKQSSNFARPLAYSTGFSFPKEFSFPFAFPELDLGMSNLTGGRKTGKQRKKRVPTLYAAMMGITSRSASAAEITGIVGRPILLSQRKRRRR